MGLVHRRARLGASFLSLLALVAGLSAGAARAATAPGAPTNIAAQAGDGQATVTWQAPVDQGGGTVTYYAIYAWPLNVINVTAGTTYVQTGLTNGTYYTFTVTAFNGSFWGAWGAWAAWVKPMAAAPSNPIALGQPGFQLGSTAAQFGTPGHPYANFMKGWGKDRQQGDPFDINPCIQSHVVLNPCSPDMHTLSGSLDQAAASANPAVKLPGRGGYSSLITIPAGQTGKIWLYNAAHGPTFGTGAKANTCDNTPGWTNCSPSADLLEDNTISSLPETDPKAYSASEYTVYWVPPGSTPGNDVLISQLIVKPIDASCWKGCTGSPSYRIPQGSGAPTTWPTIHQTYSPQQNMLVYHNWIRPDAVSPQEIAADSPDGTAAHSIITFNDQWGRALPSSPWDPSTGALVAGTYRLRIDALNWDGSIPCSTTAPGCDPTGSYAQTGNFTRMQSVAVGTGDPAANGPDCTSSSCGGGYSIQALDDMTLFVTGIPTNGGNLDTPFMYLDPSAAGRTLELNIYDPKDLNGNTSVTLVPPYPLSFGGQSAVGVFDLGTTDRRAATGITTPCNYNGGGGETNNDTAAPCVITRRSGTDGLTIQVSQGTGVWFSGHWVRFELPIPASYSPPAGAYWSLRYSNSGGSDWNVLAYQVNLV